MVTNCFKKFDLTHFLIFGYRSTNSRDKTETFTSQTDGRTGSSGVVNNAFYRPHPYEEAQIQEPEYSYAALEGDANIYDSVRELSEGNNTYPETTTETSPGRANKTDVPQETMCAEGGQENDMYSKLAQT